eukprot:scaffold1311_cov256-Pinguiococcus_pyrenoidosus.AAC.77
MVAARVPHPFSHMSFFRCSFLESHALATAQAARAHSEALEVALPGVPEAACRQLRRRTRCSSDAWASAGALSMASLVRSSAENLPLVLPLRAMAELRHASAFAEMGRSRCRRALRSSSMLASLAAADPSGALIRSCRRGLSMRSTLPPALVATRQRMFMKCCRASAALTGAGICVVSARANVAGVAGEACGAGGTRNSPWLAAAFALALAAIPAPGSGMSMRMLLSIGPKEANSGELSTLLGNSAIRKRSSLAVAVERWSSTQRCSQMYNTCIHQCIYMYIYTQR